MTGITIRDIEVNEFLSYREFVDGNVEIYLHFPGERWKYLTFESNINQDCTPPQAWTKGGFIGITGDSFDKILSLGTPYFAEVPKFFKIAKLLQKEGIRVDFDKGRMFHKIKGKINYKIFEPIRRKKIQNLRKKRANKPCYR